MTDAELIQFVRGLKYALFYHEKPNFFASHYVCEPLQNALEEEGIASELTSTDVALKINNKLVDIEHFFIKLNDGRILDPTVSEFNGYQQQEYPSVYLGEPTIIHNGTKIDFSDNAMLNNAALLNIESLIQNILIKH